MESLSHTPLQAGAQYSPAHLLLSAGSSQVPGSARAQVCPLAGSISVMDWRHSCDWRVEDAMTRAPRILIVEPEHPVRHGLCLHLELDGCACSAVPDVTSAVQRDDLGTFDLVVCHLTAGLFDAQRIIDAIRAASGRGYIPILMLATDATRAAAIIGLEHGADGFLVKPF